MHEWMREHIRTLSAQAKLTEAEAYELFGKGVCVRMAERLRNNPTYRMAFAYAVNLLSRLFPNTTFDDIGDHPLLILPWGGSRPLPDSRPADVMLSIGEFVDFPGRSVSAGCSNWMVYIDQPFDADPREPFNPILALITACYAAARITKALLGDAVDSASDWRVFSVLDFRHGTVEFDWNQPLPIGHVHLAGVGAIGSAFLCALAGHGAASGAITLIDHDRLDNPNLGRYTFFDLGDVPEYKTIAAKCRLNRIVPDLDVNSESKRFEEYFDAGYAKDRRFRVEQLISAPDRRDIRRKFQGKLPRRVWDASTGPDQVVLHHNAFDPELACLSCIYPEHPDELGQWRHIAESLGVPVERVLSGEPIRAGDAKRIVEVYPELDENGLVEKAFESIFRQMCSAGTLKVLGRDLLAPFSFVSGLAGVLLYFEFIKSLYPDAFGSFQQYNYTQLNPFYPPNPELRMLRKSTVGCECQHPINRRVFDSLWK